MTSLRRPRRRCWLVWRRAMLALALVSLPTAPRATADDAAARPQELVIFQAASLKGAFARLGHMFEQSHPGTKIVANVAGTQELRAQIEQGATADVFAAADRKQMDALAAQNLVSSSAVFACNEPVIVVRAGHHTPALASLADLPRAERLVVGTAQVPIGAYTLQILHNAGATLGADFVARVEAKIVSHELSVRQILAKVVLGEADAGIVYRSDAISAGNKVQTVEIPPDLNVIAHYPIAVLTAAPHPALARRWVDLVKSPAGMVALREAGFIPCPKP